MLKEGIHVAIDAVGAKYGGAATVLMGVLTAAVGNRFVDKLTLFVSPPGERMFNLPTSEKLSPHFVCANGGLNRLLWLTRGLPRAVQQSGAKVLLCLGNGGIGPASLPSSVLIQQSIPFYREAFRMLGVGDKLRMTSIRELMRISCRKANLVFAQSISMRNRIEKSLGISKKKIRVFPPSIQKRVPGNVDAYQLTAMRAAPKGCRLLYVGNTSPYKNLDFLVQAVKSSQASGSSLRLFLTCSPLHPLCKSPFVTGIGELNQEVLWGAYELADILIMPSLVETVGLPMLEALSVGTPVLAADRPYAHDTCEDAALYFHPRDMADFAAKLNWMMTDEGLRLNLIKRGHLLSKKRENEKPYERLVELLLALAEKQESRTQGSDTL